MATTRNGVDTIDQTQVRLLSGGASAAKFITTDSSSRISGNLLMTDANGNGVDAGISVAGLSAGGGSTPPGESLTWGSSATLWGGATFYPSVQTFSGFKHLKIRAVLKRTSSGDSLELALSSDATHCYRFAAQSDGNMVWYYNSSTGSSTVIQASGANGSNIAGYTYLELDFYPFAASVNMLRAWKDVYLLHNNGNNVGNGGSTDTHLDLTTGTFTVHVGIDSSVNIVNAVVEKW